MWVPFLVGLGTASWETLAGFSGICRNPNNYMIWLERLRMEDSTGTEDRGEAENPGVLWLSGLFGSNPHARDPPGSSHFWEFKPSLLNMSPQVS